MKKSLHIFHLNQVLVLPFQEHIQGNIFMYYSLDSLHKDIIQEFIQAIRPVQ